MLTNVRFTQAAIDHIQSIMARKSGPMVFRLDIKQTGCSGYMYQPEVVAEPQETDVAVEDEGRIQAYITAAALDAINGTEIDYVTKSLGQKQLQFDNPNATSLCGCGESFLLKGDDAKA